jgi:hypothetical protein
MPKNIESNDKRNKKPKLKQNKNEFSNPNCDPWDEAFIFFAPAVSDWLTGSCADAEPLANQSQIWHSPFHV